MTTCRSCGAPIIWAVTDAGRLIPLDREPTEDGNMIIEERDGDVHAHVLPMELLADTSFDQARYKSHFATCPNAAGWRKSRGGDD